MIVQRVEKHIIMLDNFCFLARNLYNHANFIVRNEFIKTIGGLEGVTLHPIRINVA